MFSKIQNVLKDPICSECLDDNISQGKLVYCYTCSLYDQDHKRHIQLVIDNYYQLDNIDIRDYCISCHKYINGRGYDEMRDCTVCKYSYCIECCGLTGCQSADCICILLQV